jgi:hypothetical protein
MSGLTVRESSVPPAIPAAPALSHASPRASARPPPDARSEPSAFARLLSGLGREVQRGEALSKGVETAGGSSTLDPAQLIALQAGVYRYSEAVDLAARLVDHAATGLKTILQGQ